MLLGVLSWKQDPTARSFCPSLSSVRKVLTTWQRYVMTTVRQFSKYSIFLSPAADSCFYLLWSVVLRPSLRGTWDYKVKFKQPVKIAEICKGSSTSNKDSPEAGQQAFEVFFLRSAIWLVCNSQPLGLRFASQKKDLKSSWFEALTLTIQRLHRLHG